MTHSKMRLIVASNNSNKLREFREILGERFDIVSMHEAGIDADIEENGTTFEENALIKANYVMNACHCAAIADDSGLEVDALGGAPGVYSARYCGRHGDDDAIRDALDAGVGFIALVASPRRGTALLDEMGLTGPERARISTPAGFDIGARTPPEIALSIMAELVQNARSSSASPQETAPPRSATDPVCGMTVVIGPDAITAQGQYFCGPGCRDAYLAEARAH